MYRIETQARRPPGHGSVPDVPPEKSPGQEELTMENIIDKLLHDFEQGRMNRRQLVRSLAVAASVAAAAAPASAAETGGFKAVTVNHISYQVADYARTRDF